MSELKMSEIKDWEPKLIDSKVNALRIDLFKMRMEKSTSGLAKTHQLKVAKKNIARLMTAKNQKKADKR